MAGHLHIFSIFSIFTLHQQLFGVRYMYFIAYCLTARKVALELYSICMCKPCYLSSIMSQEGTFSLSTNLRSTWNSIVIGLRHWQHIHLLNNNCSCNQYGLCWYSLVAFTVMAEHDHPAILFQPQQTYVPCWRSSCCVLCHNVKSHAMHFWSKLLVFDTHIFL